ncbi:unnamed protein product [Pieris macdunnoughi]|uniref:Uncharacterized protein n=1 Tax=Pieris macdunnoughi TaxID=345717 RepID=A0A821XNV7_9NEOP|nr:unnamed protein product [Pieris macdunnoughi]
MSTTMRPTLQTVPESLPADHVTSSPAPATTTAAAPSQPRHPRPIFKVSLRMLLFDEYDLHVVASYRNMQYKSIKRHIH